MPRLTEKPLTATFVDKVRPSNDRTEYPDATVRGLRLRVEPTGRKSWSVLGRADGKLVRGRLGEFPAMSLANARLEAVKVLGELRKGTRPKAAATAKRSVEMVVSEWLKRDQSCNRSAAEVERSFRKDVLPQIGQMDIAAVGKADIHRLLDAIIDRHAPVEANRVFSRLRRMFTWAAGRDYVSASPLTSMEAPSSEQSRDRVLTPEELRLVWNAAGREGYPFGPMTQLLILTGQRLREVSDARWSEFDLDKGIWTIPGGRAKNGVEHVVHLAPAALEVLGTLPRYDVEFLFTTTLTTSVSGFSRARARLGTDSGVTGWCFHDLRRTFATMASQDLGLNPVVIDRILNHVSSTVRGIAAVYQRGQYLDQRKTALKAWACYVVALGRTDHIENVEPLRRPA
ncbi:tyrosine-type recombinase/integrase [Skermanella pratensis]|uniref:tyrosine-type recombinase/integrase n=1 Tax=Skermanella pratensis TaxID=2233999 RepID=UPI0013016E57|nr:site-specific integrase [Skermanella pratensis]